MSADFNFYVTGLCQEAWKAVHPRRDWASRADENPAMVPAQSGCQYHLPFQGKFAPYGPFSCYRSYRPLLGWGYLYRFARSYVPHPDILSLWLSQARGPEIG